MTKPGQALIPAELLKRHLAGTLPDIDHSPTARFTYDEDGNQVDEDLSRMELHELYELAEKVRGAVKERQDELAEEKKKAYDEHIRSEYVKELAAKQASSGLPPVDNKSAEGASA